MLQVWQLKTSLSLGNNRTVAWLAEKSEEERSVILQAARALVPQHKQLAKTRKAAAIHQFKVQELAKQKVMVERREQHRLEQVQQITTDLTTAGGLWTTEQQMLTFLETIARAAQT